MSLDRKSEAQETKIKTPPPITQTTYTNPLGDQFTSSLSKKGVETHSSILSPGTQSLVNTSMASLQSLANELNAPDAQRVQQINNHAQDYYDLQAEGINQDTDSTLAQTKSDLNKRFDGHITPRSEPACSQTLKTTGWGSFQTHARMPWWSVRICSSRMKTAACSALTCSRTI